MQTKISKSQNWIWVISLVMAPFLLLISQSYWTNGVLNNTAGWIQVLAFAFWIVAFQAMYYLLKEHYPSFAALGFLIAAFACVGGAGFGYDGLYSEAIGISDTVAKNEYHEGMMPGIMFALYLPGLLFPLSLILFGIQFLRCGAIPKWLSVLLIIVGVGFPLAAMPRIQWLAQLNSLLMVFTNLMIGLHLLRTYREMEN